jgi:glycosyltransferase involved in cell wall biosynthesis
MRIAHIHSDCSPTRGIPRYIQALSEGAVSQGHEVFVFYSVSDGAIDTRLVRFRRLQTPTFPHSAQLIWFAQASDKARAGLLPALVHSHGEVPFGDVVTAHSCHRVAMRVRQREGEFFGRRNFGFVDAIRLHNERVLYREGRCGTVIALSQGTKRELQEEYDVPDSSVVVIPTGVDTARFHPSKKDTVRGAIRQSLGIPNDDAVLLIVANEFRRKGVHILLDAMSMLQDPKPWLLVVGEDRVAPVEQLARKHGLLSRVIFMTSWKTVEETYASADLFVMPSYYEAFSLASLEAASSGLPLLVTRVNGTEDLVVDGVNGLFVQRDADDIAMKIQKVLDDRARRESMAAAARLSAEPYDWRHVVTNVLSVYATYQEEQR